MSWHSRPLSPSPGALLGTGRGLKVSQSPFFSRLDNPSSPSLAPEGFQPSDQLCGFLCICSRTSTSLWRPQSCRWGLPRAEEKGKSPGGPLAVGWLRCPCAVPQRGGGERTECERARGTSCPSQPWADPHARHLTQSSGTAWPGKQLEKRLEKLLHYLSCHPSSAQSTQCGEKVLSTLPAASILPHPPSQAEIFVLIYLAIVNVTHINLKAL